MKQSTFNCHICGQPFNIIPTAEGVLLRCDNTEGCIKYESVFGFGRSEKDAAEIAKQKYRKND